MTGQELTTKTKRALAVLAAVAATFFATFAANANQAQASTCHTAAQTIVNRKNITCGQAKRVVRKTSGVNISACKFERARSHGWLIRGLGGFEARLFRKGNRSFIIEGGGKC